MTPEIHLIIKLLLVLVLAVLLAISFVRKKFKIQIIIEDLETPDEHQP